MIPSPAPLPDGLVVIFEGIDGSGKTTQLKLAEEALKAAGWPVATSRNLGGTPIGEALREVMLSKLARPAKTDLYISVAIQEALFGVVNELRQGGKVILMDRGPLSLAAYQVYGTGTDESLGWKYVEQGLHGLRPECTIFYETSVKTARERTHNKTAEADYFESQPIEYFERVAEGYQQASKRHQMTFINADLTVADIHAKTMQVIEQALRSKLSAA